MQGSEERLNLIPFATGGLQDAKLAPGSGCPSSSSSQRDTSADGAIVSPTWRPSLKETQWVARTRVHLCRY